MGRECFELGLKQNEKAIMEAYRKNGSQLSLESTTLAIRDTTDLIDSFKNVEIVFCPSPPKYSAIEIHVQAKDKERFRDYSFKWKYFSKDLVKMEFSDFSDNQTKKGIFYLKPKGSNHTLIFDVKTKF